LITLTTVGCAALSRVTNVLAFFLPLKVILLAGAQGVPQHFSFIEPGQKTDWIILLSIASIATYVLTLFLDTFSERLADSGSAGVLAGANKLALIGKQRAQARSNYTRVTQAVSAAAFGAVGLLVLAVVDAMLFASLLGLFFLEFLGTSIVLAGWRAAHPGRFQSFIRDNLGDYLNVLSSINFLAAFLLILAPFIYGSDANVLLALLAVVVIRRALPALKTAIRIVADLYEDRHAIDPLIFHRSRLQERESPEDRIVRELFSKASRGALAQKHLAVARPGLRDLEVCWQDSHIKGAYTFVISCAAGDVGRREYFQQQVFPFRQTHFLTNEDFLFSLIPRDALNAPAVLARFQEGSFEGQICEYGEALPDERYGAALERLLADSWSFKPPKKIVTAFKATRAMLPERLTAELVQRLDVASDSAAEQRTRDAVLTGLPDIRAWLERLPLHVVNPDIQQENIIVDAGGGIRMMTWARWAIEPVGAGIPVRLGRSAMHDLVGQVNSRRADLGTGLMPRDIQFADACWDFEQNIIGGRYKAALRRAAKIIDCL
jgi:hypothetical protein